MLRANPHFKKTQRLWETHHTTRPMGFSWAKWLVFAVTRLYEVRILSSVSS